MDNRLQLIAEEQYPAHIKSPSKTTLHYSGKTENNVAKTIKMQSVKTNIILQIHTQSYHKQ